MQLDARTDAKLDTRLAIDGGDPVRTKPWPTYDKGDVFVSEEDEEAGRRALRSRLYFRYDYRPTELTETGRYERKLREYFGVRHALACHSGTTAIALALMGRIEPGSVVATQGFSFAATPSAIMLAGCQPLLVEVDDDLHLDVEDLRAKFSQEIRGVVPVHMRGFAAPMPALMHFADAVGIPVFEDVVQALGVSLNGRKLGTFGLAGAFSTQSDKSINTGEGGFLITNDSTLFAKATVYCGAYEGRCARHFDEPAQLPICDLDFPIYGFRMDEIRAAVAASALDRLTLRLQLQRMVYDSVSRSLADLPEIVIRQPTAPGGYLGESLLFLVLHGRDGAAAWFAKALRREGIDARNLGDPAETNIRCFWNWRFLFPGQSVTALKEMLPRTTALLEEAVDIPLAPTLTPADCADAVLAIKKVAERLR
jgi:dTDP-4-amino-4,6-dideoxygalactose transaminase